MDRSDFGPQAWFGLVRNTAGTETCVPRDLPPELVFDAPLVDARAAAELGVRLQSAQQIIDQLVSRGILEEITGQRRNRVYAASEIIRILEESPGFDDPRPERTR